MYFKLNKILCYNNNIKPGVAEWSIARGCRPRGLVPAGVRIPPPGQWKI